ncbi:hypothetical protein JL108_14895 [Aeromicrobium sp. YIM 150415]|uniref:hypothetical protein n=1 Tax=Aeromicrobium sp. YIM 150415 TaxID=2803912 RepID=UPI001964BF50|nr:hypothetical protein [Aeromicrobium sp. YIM 150415]MBM9464741.1 hypothetical protein [Aeromicrobium sp. YIM 150415]
MSERPTTPRSFLIMARVFSIVLFAFTAILVARLVDGSADTFELIRAAVFVAMTAFWLWYAWWGLARHRSGPGA